jgi:transcription initiation factor IIE alpha subunit
MSAEAAQEPPASVAPEETYTCSMCTTSWSYQAVRNTGRCPACGGGLRRSASS